jgi:hypothetical protein
MLVLVALAGSAEARPEVHVVAKIDPASLELVNRFDKDLTTREGVEAILVKAFVDEFTTLNLIDFDTTTPNPPAANTIVLSIAFTSWPADDAMLTIAYGSDPPISTPFFAAAGCYDETKPDKLCSPDDFKSELTFYQKRFRELIAGWKPGLLRGIVFSANAKVEATGFVRTVERIGHFGLLTTSASPKAFFQIDYTDTTQLKRRGMFAICFEERLPPFQSRGVTHTKDALYPTCESSLPAPEGDNGSVHLLRAFP